MPVSNHKKPVQQHTIGPFLRGTKAKIKTRNNRGYVLLVMSDLQCTPIDMATVKKIIWIIVLLQYHTFITL